VSTAVAPVVVASRSQLDEVLDVLLGSLPPSPGATRRPRNAVVMTMGALHAGHVRLMEVARERVGDDGVVVVTVFVNPTQFSAGEDFDRYPRTPDADLAVCADAGVDVVFAPGVREMYGAPQVDPLVTVDPGQLGTILEGEVRPGHFRGMLTVVAKLLNMTRPDVALFGEKDYQQLALIRRMVRGLDFPVEVVGVPTVREPDGLALSSRNRYLDAEQRRHAAALPQALRAGAAAAEAGADAAGVRSAAAQVLADEPALVVDYVAVTDPDLAAAPAAGPARLLAAVRAGSTRLIDNTEVTLGPAPISAGRR
jgi:pantoate--beta-alanine ligase